MINSYWYNEQIRAYLLQFSAIFGGLQVKTGKDTNGNIATLLVPTVIGSRDRVAAAIQSGNTQNKPFAIPIMAANISGIELAPERRKGIGYVDRKVFMPTHGMFPDDLSVATRIMPIPYNLNVELALYASNTKQLHEILEQILIMFDPILQIQISDATFDWTKITQVELVGINNEENYPVGNDKRIILWSLNFTIPIYISAPMDFKDNIVHEINIRIGDLANINLTEVDENGELIPFNVYSTTKVTY